MASLLSNHDTAVQEAGGKKTSSPFKRPLPSSKRERTARGILSSLAQWISMSMSTGLHLVPIEQLIREAESLLQSPVLEGVSLRKGDALLLCGLLPPPRRRRHPEGNLVLPERSFVREATAQHLASGLRPFLVHAWPDLRRRILSGPRNDHKA